MCHWLRGITLSSNVTCIKKKVSKHLYFICAHLTDTHKRSQGEHTIKISVQCFSHVSEIDQSKDGTNNLHNRQHLKETKVKHTIIQQVKCMSQVYWQ